ncbi:X-Pro dipeptidyl-peptidase [Sinomonas cellulolyticus]|uniref:CocE/NonD family hydrolase n=1 Tax=Sinomonas cellulolyticus TaxID=2801916 RepID=A0ABS1K776_9MICC|nr:MULTISPECIES: CocE/NonD family hydrolase [Sinomonas]MBL0707313.1 CocE/NonD family hydrolase [Sinomonas cellulolyticus]GHG50614.1 X-Pro dipeptidyl-peptidase [Sinomonas sp. KCTC 49339]
MAYSVLIENGVETRLSDGTVLRSTVYRPLAEGERFPVLLTRTPYGRDLSVNSAYFNPATVAAEGFAVILQDVRGRFGSDGEFTPSAQEADDGAETVEWAARLPYSSGTVGMWGRSYFAESQWRAARRAPRGLAALAPGVCAAGSADNGALFRGGASELGSRLSWGHGSISLEALRREFADDPDRLGRESEAWRELDASFADGSAYDTLPLNDLKSRASTFMESLIIPSAGGEPGGDASEAWDWPASAPVPLATLHIGGWFDIFLPNTLGQYRLQLDAARHDPSVPRPRLILGPWSHASFTGLFPDAAFPGGSAAALGPYGDLSSIHAQWFRHTLAGGPEPAVPPVLVYVLGENRWRGFEELPEPTGHRELFLGPGGTLGDAPGEDASEQYDYDPLDPVPSTGGATMHLGADFPGPAEQSAVEARDDVLTFTTEPLAEPLTLFGEVTAHLYASSSAVDTDFVVRLCRVTPDGRSMSLTDGIVRASWRDASAHDGVFRAGVPRRPLTPGAVEEYTVSLWSTACTFSAGDRLRVQITSSCHPRWDRNLNTGAKALDSSDTVVAHQRIHLGAATPNRITVGVLS